MNIKRLLINILSPPKCVFCMEDLTLASEEYICGQCKKRLPMNNGKRCSVCGMPLDISYGDLYCMHCRKNKKSYAKNVSRYIYKDNVADAIRRMKFSKGQLWIADTLGKFLAETVKEEYGDIVFDGVLYVPVSKKRLRERGFNQSEIIAEAVCGALGLHLIKDILIKPVDTPKQSGLSFEQRKKNVKGAFEVKDSEEIIDKTLLLIDDIHTTGATLDECAKVLKRAGAAVVYCAAVAATELK